MPRRSAPVVPEARLAGGDGGHATAAASSTSRPFWRLARWSAVRRGHLATARAGGCAVPACSCAGTAQPAVGAYRRGAGPAQVGLAAAGHSALGVAAGGYVRAWGWSLVRGRGWDALLGN